MYLLQHLTNVKTLGIVIILSMTWNIICSDVHTSVGELVNVFKMEQELIEVLMEYPIHSESSLWSVVSDYIRQVQDLYQREDCWPLKSCSTQNLLDKIVSNPIYCYQLVRRFNYEWKKLQNEIRNVGYDSLLENLYGIINWYDGTPKDSDIQGAARALNRLQDVYQFNVTEFSRGNIMGLQTGAALGARDVFYLGRFAYMQNKPYVALNWLHEASTQASIVNDKTIEENQVQHVIDDIQKRLNLRFPNKKEEKDKITFKYRLGHVPPKSQYMQEQVTKYDNENMDALCRGKDILPASKRSKLLCYFSSEKNPFFIIQPIKIEVAHQYPHEIIIFHNFVSKNEADKIIDISLPNIQPAVVGGSTDLSEIRTSKNTWIEDGTSDLVDKISLRINRFTGLQTTKIYDDFKEGKKDEYEALQVANYGIGGHYTSHQDPMFVYKEPTDAPVLNTDRDSNSGNSKSYVTGDRMSTFMIYLSEVPKGGHTAFPRLGVSVAPILGSAVFWHNIKRSGRSDMQLLHGGCPVLYGSKWVANKWIREWANVFKRKCINNIDF